MLIGMGTVYIFLVLLMILIIISAKIFKKRVKVNGLAGVADKGFQDVIPVISAAISAYKSKKRQ